MEDLEIALVAKKSIHGVIALISRSFLLNVLSFGAFLLITAELPARDLGIYTSVIAIQRIISFFTDFGLGAALVQKKEALTEEDTTTSFTIQFLLTLGVFVLVLLVLSPIASFFRLTAQATHLLIVLVFTIFLSSFKTIPSILLERRIAFDKLIIPQIVESFTFNIILVVLVLQKFGIESFTLAFLISGVVGIPTYYYVSPWKVKFGIHRNSLTHLKYGTQFQAKNILATLKDDLLTVILVRFLSFTEIGYIGFAQKLAFFVYRYVVDSVTKVTFSAYSRIQNNKEHMEQAIEKSLFFVSSIMFPILLGTIVVIPYIIQYVPKWHNKWEPAIISLIFFCLNALVSSFSGILVNVLDATGRVKTTLRLMVIWTLLTWIFTAVGIYFYGYQGVAAASFLVTLSIGYTVYLVKKIAKFKFVKTITKPAIAAICMMGVIFIASPFIIRDLISTLFVILLGGCVYSLLFLSIAKKEIREGLKLFLKKS